MVGAGLPSGSKIQLRYVVGDPSSNPYFTLDRPLQDTSVADKATCPLYNRWRYGFDRFNGTRAAPLMTPQQYFARFVTRDVRWVVGYQDTTNDGDDTCMASSRAAKHDAIEIWPGGDTSTRWLEPTRTSLASLILAWHDELGQRHQQYAGA